MLLTSRTLKCAAILVALMADGGAKADAFFGARIHSFHLTIAARDFERMVPSAVGGDYVEVPAALQLDEQSAGTASVRYKGNSTFRYAPSELKRSLKLGFTTPGASTPLAGLSELNLNNNAFAPTQIRESLG